MTPNRDWLHTKEGIQFLSEVVSHTKATLGVLSGGFSNNAALGNPDDDWKELVADFLAGVGATIGKSKIADVDPGGLLAAALEDAYRMRFDDTYASLNVTLAKQQAQVLGLLTGNIYRIHKGEIVPMTHAYPKTNSSLTAPGVIHLHWARDVVGFWAYDHNNYDTGVPNPTPVVVTTFVEFGNGCTLC